MIDNPYFSVIIPVYNSEKYLDDCIKSVMNQTFSNFELILIDDESSDSSSVICDEWAKKYPERVRVIHQKNTGVYIAKRNGVKASSGKYIYIIDNDDLIIDKDAFSLIFEMINSNNCDVVVFNAIDNLQTHNHVSKLPFPNGKLFQEEELSIIYDEFLSSKRLHHIWTMIFNRDCFDWDTNYRESFRMLRDGPMLVLPILSNANKIFYLDKDIYFWRVQNQNSASKNYNVTNFYQSIKKLHEVILEYYSSSWKYKSAITDELIKKSYVTDICITAIKVRNMNSDTDISKHQLLSLLSNDPYFRDYYMPKSLDCFRKPIAFALYHRLFLFVLFVSKSVGLLKGIKHD